MTQWQNGSTAWYENRNNMDYISLPLSPNDPGEDTAHQALLLIDKAQLIIICKDTEKILNLLHPLPTGTSLNTSQLLLHFMEHLILDDHRLLEDIEEDIAELENSLLLGKKDNVEEIINLRKQLLGWKRYYEGMLWILDDILENENGLLDETALRQFRVHANRVDRLFHDVLNLQDYVTQVRESYQAEMDLRLNNIMKTFTVITAIFLPLTLLAGWYGMNLKMPEYSWAIGYPLVASLAVIIVILCIIFFKKNKWF